MQRFKSSFLLRPFVRSRLFISQCNRYTTLSTIDDPELVERKGSNTTTLLLNRPSVLNALNYFTVSRLLQLYSSWEDDPHVRCVVLKGEGRAFCAGGNVINTYNMIKKGNIDDCKELYQKIYSLAYVIGTYLKPQVALLNGITMGGGAAISIPGTFCVATERTDQRKTCSLQSAFICSLCLLLLSIKCHLSYNELSEVLFLVGFNTNFPGLTFGLLHSNQSSQVFANPETLIGFHPDAGASFYLSNLPGYLGEYLALTGDKLSGAEMMSCGLATHYSLSERLPLIEEQLGKLMMDDPSVIGNCLAKFEDVGHLDQMSVFQRCCSSCAAISN
ncbi:hypothetical protein AABB24_037045 [Solanum stoloniferum]|uniref:3-hydroxyisobutyryl-CoA hydrolase n=2 Tax=Solanum stoloniferum TaxID=62892 RepID=A0ABD2R2V6_9SOLN